MYVAVIYTSYTDVTRYENVFTFLFLEETSIMIPVV